MFFWSQKSNTDHRQRETHHLRKAMRNQIRQRKQTGKIEEEQEDPKRRKADYVLNADNPFERLHEKKGARDIPCPFTVSSTDQTLANQAFDHLEAPDASHNDQNTTANQVIIGVSTSDNQTTGFHCIEFKHVELLTS
jgi:hypothetical protein